MSFSSIYFVVSFWCICFDVYKKKKRKEKKKETDSIFNKEDKQTNKQTEKKEAVDDF